MQRYPSTLKKKIWIFILIFFLLMLIPIIKEYTFQQFLFWLLIQTLLVGFLAVGSSGAGSYILVNSKKLVVVGLFFLRRTISLSDITKLKLNQVDNREKYSIYVLFSKRGKSGKIQLSERDFQKDTLRGLIQNLKQLNPSIELDDAIQEFMKRLD